MPRRAPGRSAQAASSREAEVEALLALERARNAELAVALAEQTRLLEAARAQQAASVGVLRAIRDLGSGGRDALAAVAESAGRVCGADDVVILRVAGQRLETVAKVGPLRMGGGIELDPGRFAGRAVLERRTIQVDDMLSPSGAAYPLSAATARETGMRTALATPLMRLGEPIGAIAIRRREIRPLTDEEIGYLETFADQAVIAIENARLFRELADESAPLEEASRHKSAFLASMSHELRTPLNAVIGFPEVLREQLFGELNERQRRYVQHILEAGRHLLGLINDILDLSKVEAGRMELELGTFDLGPVLEAGLVMVKERASRKGVELHLELAADAGRVEADERKVKQLLFNLLTNAVKFTSAGGKVTVSSRRNERTVEMAVADTGVGIAPEDQGRVFEEFGQARSASGQSEGTGLELALCQRFVALHGGTIAVASEVGRGSTFTVALPVHQGAPPANAPAGR